MKNFFKILSTAVLFVGLPYFAFAAKPIGDTSSVFRPQSLTDSPYTLNCKEISGKNNCTLAKKNNFKDSQQQVGRGTGETYGKSIATDANGNLYVTGYTTVGINRQQQHGSRDYFIIKYDENGQVVWTQQVGAYQGSTYGNSVAADNDGNIYITGWTSVGINGEVQHGKFDYFIVKYDSDGQELWTRQVGAPRGGDTEGWGIAVDGDSDVYITGSTSVGINGQQQNGYKDYFIVKYDTFGNLMWTKQSGASQGTTQGSRIIVNNEGNNLYITGYTDVGINGAQQHGVDDYFIVKYNTNDGSRLWTEQVGVAGGDTEGNGIAIDNDDNIYINGKTTKGINGQAQHGKVDYFVAKYSNTGRELWTQQVGVSGGDTRGLGITTDKSGGALYVIGKTTVGINGQRQRGKTDYFIVKYNTDEGSVLWSRQVGASDGDTSAVGVTTDNSGYPYITGSTTVGINGQLQNGAYDAFTVSYDPNSGSVLWGRQVGG